jgi:hypothetical protein
MDDIIKIKKPKNWYVITLVILCVVLLLACGYFVWAKYFDKTSNDTATETTETATTATEETATTTTTTTDTTATATTTTSPSSTTTTSNSGSTGSTTTAIAPNPTEGWKTYTDSTYHSSFKYPATWPNAQVEGVVGEPGTPTPVSYNSVVFGISDDAKYHIRSVDLSNYTAYSGSGLEDSITKLQTLYTTKSATGAAKLWLPPSAASIMAASAPQYLETADAKWRGLYYFANIGQAYSTTISCMVIMTDGSANIVQLHLSVDSDNAAQYAATLGQDESFQNYVKSLDLNSTETIVTEFKSIYKIIAQSLTSI